MEKNGKGRVLLLDNLRGLALASMLAYHLLFDIVHLYGHAMPWYDGPAGHLWQQSICWSFLLISGAAAMYGRRPIRHGLLLIGCGLLIRVATTIVTPQAAVRFGVLSLLGWAGLLTGLLRKPLAKLPAGLGLGLSAGLFVFTRLVPQGALGLLEQPLWPLPASLYQSAYLYPLGLPGPGFTSGDYFPLLPWLFLYWAGMYLWRLLAPKVEHTRAARLRVQPFTWLGQHSLLLYMLHQPLFYGLLELLHSGGLV